MPVRPPLLSTFAVDACEDVAFEPHSHDDHEMLWGATGTFVVEAGDRTWVVPPMVGVWVPAGSVHGGYAKSGSTYWGTMFDRGSCPIRWAEPTAVAIVPALREMLLHLHHHPMLGVARRNAETVVLDLIRPLAAHGVSLPMPADSRALQIARALSVCPGDRRGLDDWGREVGASGRTLMRLFLGETGMTFTTWRAHARVCTALQHLATGATVTTTARTVGYGTTSAFVRIFKQVTGSAPRAYLARPEQSERDAPLDWHVPERIRLSTS